MSSNRSARPRTGHLFLFAGVVLLVLGLASGGASAAQKVICYAIADDGNGTASGSDGAAEDLLTRIDPDDADPATNETSIGTGTDTFNVEAATFEPGTTTLYAVDADQLGTVNISSGVFSATSATVGGGDGAAGPQTFDDVDGIVFDPADGTLYGIARQQDDAPDLLIQIDPATGAHVADAFGAGVDYVVIDPIGTLTNGDDLAIGADGTMYGILSDGGNGDHLVTIDKGNGNTTDVGATGVNDMEGLSIAPDGHLFGTTGQESTEGEALWDISRTTGAATNGRALDNAGDYEAVACLTEGSVEPSPSPSVIPTGTETTVTGPSPSVSPTVKGIKVIPETGPSTVAGLAIIGSMSILAGMAMLRIGKPGGRHAR